MNISLCRMVLVEGPGVNSPSVAVVTAGQGSLPCYVTLCVMPAGQQPHPLLSVHAFETKEAAIDHYSNEGAMANAHVCYFPVRS